MLSLFLSSICCGQLGIVGVFCKDEAKLFMMDEITDDTTMGGMYGLNMQMVVRGHRWFHSWRCLKEL